MEENYLKKERHGFVTFWLWFGIIVNIIALPINLVKYQSFTNLGEVEIDLRLAGFDTTPFSEAIHPHVLILQIVTVISGICLIVSYSMLLKWKKTGFWLFVIIGVVDAIVTGVMMHLIEQDYSLVKLIVNFKTAIITQAVAAPLSILVLWAILQIKKNGVSCWKLLE